MIQDIHRIERIFNEARARTGLDRERFLDEACANLPELRSKVSAMLEVDESQDGLSAEVLDDPSNFSLVGSTLADFQITSVIGGGGMGTVYEATQAHPRRSVALKVMRRGVTSRAALRRFRYEAQILGRLRHSGIAEIYAAGVHTEDGSDTPYFAMEFVPDARTLLEYAASTSLGLRDRLVLFKKICEAVQHGHQRGVIHRDLKPANLLIDGNGEPKVIDFGVARSTDVDIAVTTIQTEMGQLIGTLQYMSPEQCDGEAQNLDVRSDVYSLGIVLYELLAGTLPYDASSPSLYQATKLIRETTPPRLSSWNRRLKGDVEGIVHKALEKAPDQRYQSSGELAEDIGRHLDGQPVEARPPSFAYYISHLFRRYRLEAVAAIIVVASLVGSSIGVGLWSFERGKRAEVRESQASRLVREANFSLRAMAQQSIGRDDGGTAKAELGQIPEEDRGWEWDYLFDRVDLSELEVSNATRDVNGFELNGQSPELEIVFPPETPGVALLASLHSKGGGLRLIEFRYDGGEYEVVREVELAGLPREELPHYAGMNVTRSGRTIALVGALKPEGASDRRHRTGFIRFVDLGPDLRVVGSERFDLEAPQGVGLVAAPLIHGKSRFSPSGRYFAAGSNGGPVVLIERAAERVEYLNRHTWIVEALDFNEDETRLATGSHDLSVRIWDTTTGDEVGVLRGHSYYVMGVRFQPGGSLLGTASVDGSVRLWDLPASEAAFKQDPESTGVEVHRYTDHTRGVRALDFSGDGLRVVSGAADRSVRLWEVRSNARVVQFQSKVLSSWEVPRFRELGRLRGHHGKIHRVWYEPHDEFIASLDRQGFLKFFPPRPIPDVVNLLGHGSSVFSVDFSDRRSLAVSGGGDNCIVLWDVKAGRPYSRIQVPAADGIHNVGIQPGRDVIAYSSADGHFGFYNIEDPLRPASLFEGSESLMSNPPTSRYRALVFSPSGRRLATGTEEGNLLIWEERGGRWTQVASYSVFVDPVSALCFLDDDTLLLGRCASHDLEDPIDPVGLRVLDLNSGLWLDEVRLASGVKALDYHAPTGIAAAATSAPARGYSKTRGSLVAWDVSGGRLQERGRAGGESTAFQSVAIHPNGRIFTGSSDHTMTIWSTDTLQPLLSLREHAGGVRDILIPGDGKLVMSTSIGDDGTDNAVKLFWRQRDRATSREVARLQEEWAQVRSASFILRTQIEPEIRHVEAVFGSLEPRHDPTLIQVLRFYQGESRVRKIVDLVEAHSSDDATRNRVAEWIPMLEAKVGSQ